MLLHGCVKERLITFLVAKQAVMVRVTYFLHVQCFLYNHIHFGCKYCAAVLSLPMSTAIIFRSQIPFHIFTSAVVYVATLWMEKAQHSAAKILATTSILNVLSLM